MLSADIRSWLRRSIFSCTWSFAVIEAFRGKGDEVGRGYQNLINDALTEYIAKASKPLDERTLQRILREEELNAAS